MTNNIQLARYGSTIGTGYNWQYYEMVLREFGVLRIYQAHGTVPCRT